LKIFELLEQHAANSSFCSTSSLVARLMDGSINSTPVKTYPLLVTRNHQNEKLTASLLHPHSLKDHSTQEQMLSGSHQFQNKNTICEHLPCGLDNADSESLSNDNLKSGACEKSGVSKLTLRSSNHWESGDGQTSVNTSSSSIGVTSGVNSPCNKHLHVRFAETNEYKSVSDVDALFSSQNDTNININYSDNCKNQQLETTNYERKNGKHFQDDQAWSDDCSCTSSDESDSFDSSLNTKFQTPTAIQSLKPSSLHQTVNQQVKVCSTDTSTDRSPLIVDKSSHDCVNNVSHIDGQDQADFRVATQSNSNNEIVFKSALLRTRLEELEKEIEIFRRENAILRKTQKKHEEEVLRFNKDRKELEKKMNEEKENMESYHHEERTKQSK
jgi:centromere protein J